LAARLALYSWAVAEWALPRLAVADGSRSVDAGEKGLLIGLAAPLLQGMKPANVVTLHYTLRDPSGRVIDSSSGGEPITYLEGAGQVIDGLDEALRGVAAGSRQRVSVVADRAYGEPDPAQVQRVPRAQIPFSGDINVGDRFQTDTDPHAPVVTVVAVDEESVTLDANHPLAGMDLDFEVEVLAVREATPEELSHGHAHGRDGHAHCH